MSARSRPRAQLKEEVDEERTLWTQIQADAKKIDQLVVSFLWGFHVRSGVHSKFKRSSGIECKKRERQLGELIIWQWNYNKNYLVLILLYQAQSDTITKRIVELQAQQDAAEGMKQTIIYLRTQHHLLNKDMLFCTHCHIPSE